MAVFDARAYDRAAFLEANVAFGHELVFLEPRLEAVTARLADGFPAVCSFVNDRVDAATCALLRSGGTELVALRSAGFNHVDLAAARAAGIRVVRVPAYSPHAVAEHAVALLLTLNRKTHRAHARIRELNFSLDGLVGFDLFGKTVGVIGTGRIGDAFARIMLGFGCKVVAYDLRPVPDLVAAGVRYVTLDVLLAVADVVSLHVPLTPETHHLLDDASFAAMKPGAILINTSRGGLVSTSGLIGALKRGHLSGACLDVYEVEGGVFFEDLSESVLQDDVLARLLTFPNVLVTSHQGFLTHEALANIATTTLESVAACERGEPLVHEIEHATGSGR